MQRVQLGQTSLKVSPICYGGWQMGQTFWGKQPEETLVAAVHKALDVGVNFFDTADAYGNGLGEEILGRALKGRPRDDFVVATKVYHHWHGEGFDAPRHPDLSAEYLEWECEQSLKRLGLDHIDVYLAHQHDPLTPFEETARAFDKLKNVGKIRYAGASNYTLEQVRAAEAFAPVEVVQPMYNLLDREAEADLLPHCQACNIGVFVYSPLAHGMLTGKYTGSETFDDFRKNKPRFTGQTFRKTAESVRALQPIAEEYNASITQIVLAATYAHPSVHCAIAGVKKPEHIADAAGAMNIKLSRADYHRIRQTLT